MTRNSKYGNMPTDPELTATVKGDAGTYRVLGVDWWNRRVLLDRAGLEWIDIKKVALSKPESRYEVREDGDGDLQIYTREYNARIATFSRGVGSTEREAIGAILTGIAK